MGPNRTGSESHAEFRAANPAGIGSPAPDPSSAEAAGGPSAPRPDLFDKCRGFTRAKEAQAAGLYPYFIPISGSEGTEVRIEGERKIMLGSNNYLGLTHDPRVLDAAEGAARTYGSGCTGSRFLNGTLDLHEKLERELAEYVGKEAALVFSTGFQTNLGIIATLAGRDDAVILDKLDHACIIDGAILSQANVYRFNHNDVAHLEKVMQRVERELPRAGKLVVVDGIFSMEGDIADLPRIIPVVRKYGARILVDEAHSVGVMGPGGSGVHEHFGLSDDCDLLMGTFSKSFASIGGFAASTENTIHYLKHHARSLIFSASMPPYAVATVREALRIARAEPERRDRLWANQRRLKDGLEALGFNLGTTTTPVVPVIVGETQKTFVFWKTLFEMGVFTNPVIPPAVPEHTSRIRTSLMATHTGELIDEALEIFQRAGKKVGLI
ncbi:MAG: aminotransferase class I/II-fold pyridoxal phosphate-dependent enzyme [Candidatus Eisenbacteria bacterium]|nr:aminotransferase class I/II-fold pyridoxal phosphate-dependent enzyme [Candidatus Eisenbacteria bacterium]